MQAKITRKTAESESSIDTLELSTKTAAKKKMSPKVKNCNKFEKPYIRPEIRHFLVIMSKMVSTLSKYLFSKAARLPRERTVRMFMMDSLTI